MADNISFQTTVATPASGTLVSTEEVTTLNGGAVTAQHIQRIAVAIRTSDGVAIDLPGDSSNGLDVDVTRIVPGTGATNLGKAEDAAHSSGDTGVMALGVRQDADAALGADGDYAPLQFDSNGYLKVNIKAGAGSGGTAMTDDSAFTPASSSVTPMGAFYDDISPDSVNEGDIGAVRMSGNRNLYTVLRDAAGNERGANVDASGQLLVVDENSVNIYNTLTDISGYTSNIQGAHPTDDSVFAPGSNRVTAMGAFFDDVSPDSVNEGDIGAVRMSGNRNLYIQIRDGEGNERSAYVNSSNQLEVSDPLARSYLGNLNSMLKVDDDAKNGGGTTIGVMAFGVYDDAAPDSVDEDDTGYIRMSANRNLYIQIRDAAGNERGLNIDASGQIAIAQATASSLNAQTVGNIAHDGVDSGNPLKIGGKAIAHGSNPTAVAAGDRTDLYANRHGIPFVISGHPNILTLRANYTAAQTDTAIITQGAGGKIVVTRVSVTADNANSVDVQARIGFGAANTPTTTGVLLSHPGIAAGSGVVEGSGAGILGVGADGEDLRITSEVPTDGSIDVLVSYYTIES